MNEAVLCLIQTKEQRASLKSRGIELAKRDVANLDKLEEQDRQASEVVFEGQSNGTMVLVLTVELLKRLPAVLQLFNRFVHMGSKWESLLTHTILNLYPLSRYSIILSILISSSCFYYR